MRDTPCIPCHSHWLVSQGELYPIAALVLVRCVVPLLLFEQMIAVTSQVG